MNVLPTELPEVLVIEPRVFRDDRGWFTEFWNASRYESAGISGRFVQDNVSFSRQGVLRGLHYQWPAPQGKLIQALQGEIYDVAVDIRVGSPRFGRWISVTLSAENARQIYIPEGFAHGFVVLSEFALVAYKCTAPYRADADASLLWNDPALGIGWPCTSPYLAEKDRSAPCLRDVRPERLPTFPGL